MALRAVIVGSGLGGMAAAVALAQAGIDVQVYEQAQQLTEVGAGVSLAPNGLRMLERLGVGEGIPAAPQAGSTPRFFQAERGAWEPKLTVDGIENKLAATAFAADPAERFGYGLQLVIDGIRQQLAHASPHNDLTPGQDGPFCLPMSGR